MEICQKCKGKTKILYRIAVMPKLEAKFCNECCNKWFDLRDKLVSDAFRQYLPVSKAK